MKVSELIALLEILPDDALVVMARDSEGNSYSPLRDITSGEIYAPESRCHGEIYLAELTPELMEQGYTDEDVYTADDREGVEAIVLWPIN